jgi:hypothetical protein
MKSEGWNDEVSVPLEHWGLGIHSAFIILVSSFFALAAFGAGCAAGLGHWLGNRAAFTRKTNATREAVGVFPAAAEDELFIDDLAAFDGELRHDAVFVFDFDGQLMIWQHIARFVEDHGQFTGDESMIDIVVDPGLQQTSLQRATGGAAVDETLQNVAHLGDVEVCGDETAIRQQEADGFIGVGAQCGEEVSDVHGKN